jgi:hypothetical protein
MRGISWLAATTGQLLKKDSAVWSKVKVKAALSGFIRL